jgi:hypothetical protein
MERKEWIQRAPDEKWQIVLKCLMSGGVGSKRHNRRIGFQLMSVRAKFILAIC